jgi:hypothetical protein
VPAGGDLADDGAVIAALSERRECCVERGIGKLRSPRACRSPTPAAAALLGWLATHEWSPRQNNIQP